MARLRYNGLSATLGGSLTNSATSVTFGAALTHSNGTNVPTITGSDYIPLAILDASGHLSEIVYLTAYTAAATTGTISRGKEGTAGVSHSSGDKVAQGPFVNDLVAGFTQVKRTSDLSLSAGTWTAIGWDAEDFDTLGLHDNATNNSRLTIATPGIYLLTLSVDFNSTSTVHFIQFGVNGTRVNGRAGMTTNSVSAALTLARMLSLSAGDYVEGFAYGSAASGLIANTSDAGSYMAAVLLAAT